jgi:hypothetical protein
MRRVRGRGAGVVTDLEFSALIAIVNAETQDQRNQIEAYGHLTHAPDPRASMVLTGELERRGIIAQPNPRPDSDEEIPY